MDLRKVPSEEKLNICRRYYYGGFIFLPFLWVVNSIWFFRDAFIAPPFDQQKTMKTYLIRSMIGASIWTVAFITWLVIFQVYRAEWGATADYMSFIIPKGIP